MVIYPDEERVPDSHVAVLIALNMTTAGEYLFPFLSISSLKLFNGYHDLPMITHECVINNRLSAPAEVAET